ncbi:HNH endonuclease signature motif containing protein [Intrasporangium flavum]|uniref:HNH endonuclease signature motif containing protein n=1 Tax=Intrasporangium flavum TaxID=1428657 RepID=UPI00096FCA0D|nr:HNH endonuclease signature motif containing protein [Intrasporangium flavum]
MPYLDAQPAAAAGGLARVRRILTADRARREGVPNAVGLAVDVDANASEHLDAVARLEPVAPDGFRDVRLDAAGDRVLAQVEALERTKARLEARLLEAYAALHAIQEQQLARLATAAPVPVSTERVVAAEIACATGVGEAEVSRRLELALATRRHRVLRDALRHGRVSLYRALTVVAETRLLPDEVLPDVTATVLAPAPDGTCASQRLFRARLRRCVTAADHRGTDERHITAMRRRGVFGRLVEDGMGVISITATAERVVGVLDRVQALARAARASGDERTLDQLRSDLLTDLALFGTTPDGPTATAPPAVVRIVVPFEVAAGVSDAACELPGHGWVTAAHARQIMTAPGSTWQRLAVAVDTGTALQLSTDRYTPTRAMAEHVRALDGVCRAPGCTVPAERCDLDHITPWPAGPTDVDNLQSLSRGCHHPKTARAWTAHRPEGPDHTSPSGAGPDGVSGAVHWTTLAGRDYVTYPRNWREGLADPGAGSGSGTTPPRAGPPEPELATEPEPPPF